ncbi:hypothetical protein CVD28_01685 [Bacillus sp. M6-12]|uniref:hypothetical protein n=1 Tax=Bacillus sp. M6-12 TaxID=2054166 RepID=UPI000C77C967|nr:hypothetical protein [Bacillus sp. M6-12]PLS19145.1 hypothetical protein CVD28_01685 [Bacillus sp. M6-12]
MEYGAIIYVDKKEAEEMERILSIQEGDCPDYDHDATIKTYTAKFANGFQADIKVCNGDTPYIDNVLFDEQGCEVDCPEISESLLGEYDFQFEGDSYRVLVESVTLYDNPLKGISIFSGEPVEVIGERTEEKDGKVLEQYLYNIVNYTAKNGQPFVSLKANISIG